MKCLLRLSLVMIVPLIEPCLTAQADLLSDSSAHPLLPPRIDSTLSPRSVVPEEPSVVHADSTPVKKTDGKSPTLAMLLSAALPGAGQVYNRSYWKAPIIIGFGVYFLSSWLDQNRRYEEAREKYQQSLTTSAQGDSRELLRRDFYRDQRDTFTWYLVILYVLNLADAYVDASLYDFNVGGDLAIQVGPQPPGVVGVRITF